MLLWGNIYTSETCSTENLLYNVYIKKSRAFYKNLKKVYIFFSSIKLNRKHVIIYTYN